MSSLLMRLIRPYRGWLAIVVVAMLVETLMSLATPWPLKIVLDSVIGDRPLPGFLQGMIGEGTTWQVRLGWAAGGMLVVALLQAASAYLAAYFAVSTGQWIAHDLRQAVYAHLQRLSLSYYDRRQIGPIISTITDDVNAVQDFASTSLLDLLIDTLTVLGMLGIMFALNWKFTLVALAVMPLLLLFVVRLRAAVSAATHEVRRRQGDIVSVVQEGLGAIRVVKAFAQGAFERQRLDETSKQSVQAALHARRVRSLLGPVVTCLTAAGSAGVLWFGAREVMAGAMTAGALVIFINYLGRFFRPIQAIARAGTDFAQAAVGLERVRALLAADERLPRAPGARALEGARGLVAFHDVTFAYEPGRPVLRNITFEARPGELVALVGRSGSGKSTIASLIPRFYDPDEGSVTIDGEDVRAFTVRSVRRQIGFVLQETQLFHAPVWQNIAYGNPAATREQIIEAARTAHAHEFIEALPDGYDTIVGQGGLPLSGGQRQRIGIARALVRDAPILILDEPTSGLDAESERLVMDGVQRLRAGRTAFVITHRLATVQSADQILVLDQGRIVERGAHGDLLAKGGLYAEFIASVAGERG